MSNTPNMGLIIDVPLITPGPEWAADVAQNFQTTDAHDHTASNGVRIPTAGLNINEDLSLNSLNLNDIRALRLDNQTTTLTLPADLRILYSKNGELAYRDGAGNEVVITSNGSIAGATGTITGLVTPASASYSSINKTFTVNQDTAKPAKFNISEISLYEFDNATANPVTIASPAALATPYTLTLPAALPATPMGVMILNSDGTISHLDVAGNMNSGWVLRVNDDGTAFEINTVNQGGLNPLSVGTAALQDASVTNPKLADGSISATKIIDGQVTFNKRTTRLSGNTLGKIAVSSTSGNFTGIFDSGPVQVTNFSLNLDVGDQAGVRIEILPDNDFNSHMDIAGGTANYFYELYRDGVMIQSIRYLSPNVSMHPTSLTFLDYAVPAGTHNYKLYLESGNTMTIFNYKMIAYEI